jgi:hypothetical protein
MSHFFSQNVPLYSRTTRYSSLLEWRSARRARLSVGTESAWDFHIVVLFNHVHNFNYLNWFTSFTFRTRDSSEAASTQLGWDGSYGYKRMLKHPFVKLLFLNGIISLSVTLPTALLAGNCFVVTLGRGFWSADSDELRCVRYGLPFFQLVFTHPFFTKYGFHVPLCRSHPLCLHTIFSCNPLTLAHATAFL